MGVIITPQNEIDAYYASESLGQSKLKKLARGVDTFKIEEDLSSKPHIILGKAVDTILTGEEGEFEKAFYVSSLEKTPSDTVAGIILSVFNRVKEDYDNEVNSYPVKDAVEVKDNGDHISIENDTLEFPELQKSFPEFAGYLYDWEAYILDACAEVNYQSRWGAEAKMKAICEPGTEYFQDLSKSFGKTIIDSTTYNKILSITSSLKTHWRTAKYFDRETQSEFENVTFIYQMPIYFNYKGVECKALLDLVVVVRDEQGKIISVEGIDLKTMSGNTTDFLSSIKSYRYDIQGAWYSAALIDYYALQNNLDVLKPFKFIVESTINPGKPLIYQMSETLLKIGKEGRPSYTVVDTSFSTSIPEQYVILPQIDGFDQLIDLFIYHTEKGWEVDKDIIEADEKNEHLIVDWNGIINV